MKTLLHRHKYGNAGSALLLVLLFAAIVLPILWGALDLNVKTQHRSVARSQQWNASLPLVEAGVEEALAHLNRNCYSNSVNGGVVKWHGVDGWTESSPGVYSASRKQVGDSFYDLFITVNDPASTDRPEIICTAFTPGLFARLGIIPMYAALPLDSNGKPMIGRRVQVSTAKYNLFMFGLLAKGNIKFNGRPGLNSFDSQSWSNSFYGLYDPRYASDNATIGSTDGSIDLGSQGEVHGNGTTSPSGTLTNGAVGETEWIRAGNQGIQDGHYTDDLNMNILDVELPYGAASWPMLYSGNYVVTITNPVRVAKTIISATYPNPPPPGGILATNTLLVTTDYYPIPAPDTGVRTNAVKIDSGIYPDPVPEGGVTTNATPTWLTSQTYPLSFLTPPGVVTNTELKTNVNSAPLAGTYVGSVTIEEINPKGGGNKDKYTNYIHNRIMSYNYKLPESYTWTNYTYTYLTDTAYKYVGAVTNIEVVTRSYKYAPLPGNYRLSNLSLSGNEQMLIRAPGHTTLYVEGAIDMKGQSQIVIEYGASVSIYVAGNVDLGGQGIMNENDSALNFALYGLNTCTNISISGNASLTGTIYAPYANIKANGGGKDTHDIIGAIVGASVTFNGHFNLHYDEALSRVGPSWGFYATRWAEIPVDDGD